MLEGDEGDGHGYQEGFPKATSPGVRSIFPRSGKASWRGSHQPQDVLRRQHSREKKRGQEGFSCCFSWFGTQLCCLDRVHRIWVLIRNGRRQPLEEECVTDNAQEKGAGHITQGHRGSPRVHQEAGMERESVPEPSLCFPTKAWARQGRQA